MLVNKKTIAERYGVSTVTIDTWERENDFPVQRMGRIKKPRYDTADCDLWVYGSDPKQSESGDEK